MLDVMQKSFPLFRGRKVRVRCFGHILNLVVKAILSQFERKRQGKTAADKSTSTNHELDNMSEPEEEEDDNDVADPQEADEDREAADDKILDNMEDENPDLKLSMEQIAVGQLALMKILKLSTKVWNNVPVRAELSKLAADADLESEVLVR
ncbi:hypothetical protein L226DRAFT_431446, partial [Lentinus tigrinus ALCF2SS1-7]|uniref:uncharacterized protein n=1 Tax=Lentinus tigrinus ALCF2SS1-7 TaxID=1328758 RepID=UPI0011663619